MDALENLNKVNAADKDLVVRWYNLSADENRNPEHLVNLSTQGREQFALMAELFGDIESKVMKDLLRFYISAATRNSELFKFHLIDKLLGSGFNIKLENFKYDNFKRPLYFPEFSTHFDPEHLSSFRFIDIFTTNPSFRTYFLSIMTQQLIDNLDERYNRYLENSQQGVADLYTYETYLEDIYLDLILNGFFDKSTIVQWLGIYPFRLMNEKGDTVPDNFYKSFQGHIVENNTAEYLDFFKQLKLIKKGNHSTHEVFMKDYDSHATTRSVLFREDFYFMNSLYFRGAQLKRSFWIQLDSILQSSPDKRYIGEYLSKVQLVDECCSKDMPKSKLESFYNEMLTLFPIDKQDELEILKVAISILSKYLTAYQAVLGLVF